MVWGNNGEQQGVREASNLWGISVKQWIELIRKQASKPPSPKQAVMRDIAARMREISARLVRTKAKTPVLENVAKQLQAVEQQLQQHQVHAERGQSSFGETSGVSGKCSPISPPLHITLLDSSVRAVACFSAVYEGPPNGVHGGFVSAVWDEALGIVQGYGGAFGMTKQLTIEFHNMTPLFKNVVFEARVDKREGRKTFCVGRAYVEGEEGVTLSTARALFVSGSGILTQMGGQSSKRSLPSSL
mmetsp:Transcript_21156/g.41965  ORF Transcript_21156/g.41965 Transcript_21156/m.41965 type:complete len:244 (-) Transcript_21156:605-1336(-)